MSLRKTSVLLVLKQSSTDISDDLAITPILVTNYMLLSIIAPFQPKIFPTKRELNAFEFNSALCERYFESIPTQDLQRRSFVPLRFFRGSNISSTKIHSSIPILSASHYLSA